MMIIANHRLLKHHEWPPAVFVEVSEITAKSAGWSAEHFSLFDSILCKPQKDLNNSVWQHAPLSWPLTNQDKGRSLIDQQ